MKILGAAIGNCVHVAGVYRFLRMAEENGHDILYLGPAVPLEELFRKIEEYGPDVIGVSYRLSVDSAFPLLRELKKRIVECNLDNKRWLLGCTAPIKPVARELNMFEEIFTGFSTDDDTLAFLRGHSSKIGEKRYPQDLISRITMKGPMPIIRHHFGLPSLEKTIRGVEEIAGASVLDVISIGPDQDAQQSFFRSSEISDISLGDGGVPLRRKEDLEMLYQASRTGNFPLLRCYSGTRDLLDWAQMLKDTINNAWCATPLLWYSELDGRSDRPLESAFRENKMNHEWHAKRGVPVEVNEAHHWSLRSAHDTIAVAMAYLAAYNAKAVGVHTYVAQYMLNTPLGTSPKMDLAKMLAKIELIESLHDHRFQSIRQVRPGLFSYPPDLIEGKGQLAASVSTGMLLRPHIVHVVAFCEADHVATPEEVIESCKITRRVIHNSLLGSVNPLQDRDIRHRKDELVREAKLLVSAIASFDTGENQEPLTKPVTYSNAIKAGVLDAPHLRNNSIAIGELQTSIINGACCAIDSENKNPINEETRLEKLGVIVTPDIKRRVSF
ncbi:MAG: cobalamin B12-binding domain-containing protein [Candidatus Thorarchaeota archaeon]